MPSQSQPGASAPDPAAIDNTLRTSIEQTGAALRQANIRRWKLSRQWKSQLTGDANSIQQDLAGTLPALFQAASQAPGALGPQLELMHNIDALYDVLVRISTAAGLAGGESDAAILDRAVQQLESARKAAAAEMLARAAESDRQRARLTTGDAGQAQSSGQKTIVVENRVGHHSARRGPHPKAAHPRTDPAANHP